MNLPRFFGRFTPLLLGLGLSVAFGLSTAKAQEDTQLNAPQVDQLLGPIALYPDALVALILPASTNPADIVLAARFLNNGGDPDQIDNQPWNDSVRDLARYPQVIKWMDENLTWTQQLGAAFLNQPDDVMSSVQRLRARARATGALTSTPQQKLVLDGDVIEIVPAQPDVIYVPYYDPDVVYVTQPDYYYGPYLTFGAGLPIGFWLSYDFNWRTRVILVGDRHHNWRENHDWNRHTWSRDTRTSGSWRAWQAPANRPAFARPDARRPRSDIVRPNPPPGAPPYPRDPRGRDGGRPRPDSAPQGVNRGHVPVPVPNPRPDTLPVPGNPPRPNGNDRHPLPTPSNATTPPNNNRDNRDHRDGRDGRDNRPTPQTSSPRPEHPVPVVTNQPQPVAPAYQPPARDIRVPPAPDVRVPPTRDVRVAPSRPEPRAEPRQPNPAQQRQANPPPPRQATPPPAPPPPQDQPQDRNPRDRDKEVQR